jgi:endonuclease YncB( thermonuclease family)
LPRAWRDPQPGQRSVLPGGSDAYTLDFYLGGLSAWRGCGGGRARLQRHRVDAVRVISGGTAVDRHYGLCSTCRAMRRWIAAVMLIAASPSWATMATVKDGNTVRIDRMSFRLEGIDAPEPDQMCLDANGSLWACGVEARTRLMEFIGDRAVRCDDKGPDTAYPARRIGVCHIEGDSTTLNQWLVREGWALDFERSSKGRFASDQADARISRRGLWKGCFADPQDLRRWNKRKAKLMGAACPSGDEKVARNALFRETPACRRAARSRACSRRAPSSRAIAASTT